MHTRAEKLHWNRFSLRWITACYRALFIAWLRFVKESNQAAAYSYLALLGWLPNFRKSAPRRGRKVKSWCYFWIPKCPEVKPSRPIFLLLTWNCFFYCISWSWWLGTLVHTWIPKIQLPWIILFNRNSPFISSTRLRLGKCQVVNKNSKMPLIVALWTIPFRFALMAVQERWKAT